MKRRHFLASATAAFASPGALFAAHEGVYQSGVERVSTLELFTSEGCSSCPPAEEWFSKLRGEPGLWSRFVPMSFHVAYWDNLGWKDSFSAKAFTDRQYRYAAQWGADRVYTPCFVLNGREWKGSRLSLPSPEKVGNLILTPSGGKGGWATVYEPLNGSHEGLIHHVALLGAAASRVAAGENEGRTIKHDFVVLGEARAAAGRGRAVLKVPSDSRGVAIAAWVSKGEDPTPLQAVGGWL